MDGHGEHVQRVGKSSGAGYFKYRRIANSVWLVSADRLNCNGATVADGTTILTAGNAGWASPASNHLLAAYCDALKTAGTQFESASLRFNSDGSVSCLGISTAATTVSCHGLLFVDI